MLVSNIEWYTTLTCWCQTLNGTPHSHMLVLNTEWSTTLTLVGVKYRMVHHIHTCWCQTLNGTPDSHILVSNTEWYTTLTHIGVKHQMVHHTHTCWYQTPKGDCYGSVNHFYMKLTEPWICNTDEASCTCPHCPTSTPPFLPCLQPLAGSINNFAWSEACACQSMM